MRLQQSEQSIRTTDYLAKITTVLECACDYVDAVNTIGAKWPDAGCNTMNRYIKTKDRCEQKLIDAVNAMKGMKS